MVIDKGIYHSVQRKDKDVERKLGLWREDKPSYDVEAKPKKCRECGCKSFDWERLPDDDEWDGEMEDAYEVSDADDWDARFAYVHDHAVCEECGEWHEYGQRWYWNEESGEYDLNRMLTPAAAKLAEAEAERQAQINAGQLVMF